MNKIVFILFLFVAGCVGTDSVNDEIVTLAISVNQASLVNNVAATMVNGQFSFSASATNDRGNTYEPEVTWNSSNTSVATIDENGNLQAIAPGNTSVTATARSIQSNAVTISVVEGDSDVALIEITAATSMIDIDESITLTTRALNTAGDEVPDAPITLQSEDETVASVNADGQVTGLSGGETTIIARSGNVSGSFPLSVGQATSRSGTFEGTNGYNVEGGVALQVASDNRLSLELKEDFSASSGPGLFIYLTDNGTSIAGGLEVGELRSSTGADSYAVPPGVTLDQYDQVLIYCKPFGVPFGVAELNSDS